MVVSESVGQDLDTSLDFVTVVSEQEISDRVKLKQKIEHNRQISINKRNEIRQYAIDNFGLENILMNSYVRKLRELSL